MKNNIYKKDVNKQKGFTLLEILVSGAVLALVMVGLATLMTYTMKSDSQARVRSYSAELAQSRIDFFRHERNILGWAGLSTVLETRTYCLNGVNSFSTSVGNNVFSGLPTGDNCSFVEVSGDIPAQIKQVASVVVDTNEINVEIIISWLNDAGDEVSVNSVFKLTKDSHIEVYAPVAPSPTLTPLPAPTGISSYSWFDGYGSSCAEGQTYYFIIYAYDSEDNHGLGSSTQFMSISQGDDAIGISWLAVAGADYYRVYMSSSPDMSNPYYITALDENVDSYCTGSPEDLPS